MKPGDLSQADLCLYIIREKSDEIETGYVALKSSITSNSGIEAVQSIIDGIAEEGGYASLSTAEWADYESLSPEWIALLNTPSVIADLEAGAVVEYDHVCGDYPKGEAIIVMPPDAP